MKKKKKDKQECVCKGCHNQINVDSLYCKEYPYCKECNINLFSMRQPKANTNSVYCELHEIPPIEEKIEPFQNLNKQEKVK